MKGYLFFAWQFFVTHALFKFFLRKLIVGFTLEAKVVSSKHLTQVHLEISGADPGFFSGGGALVSCSTSTPINHIFFLQNTSSIRKPQVISGGVRTPCTLPLDPPLNLKSLCRKHGFTLVHKVYYLKYQLTILFHGKILNAFALEKGYL